MGRVGTLVIVCVVALFLFALASSLTSFTLNIALGLGEKCPSSSKVIPPPSGPVIFPPPVRGEYKLALSGEPYPGGSAFLVSSFINLGKTSILVRGLVFSTEFSTQSSHCNFVVNPHENKTAVFPFKILLTTESGDYVMEASAEWSYPEESLPGGFGWAAPRAVVTSVELPIRPNPVGALSTGIIEVVPVGMGVYTVLVWVAVVYLRLRGKRKPKPKLEPGTIIGRN